jgi:hypothetical protein
MGNLYNMSGIQLHVYSLYDTPSRGRRGRVVVLVYNYMSNQRLLPPTL